MKKMNKKLIVCVTSIMILLMLLPTQPVSACGGGGGNKRKHTKITIVRDNYGVPHVYAKTNEGLAFGAGYAIGQD